MFVLALAGVLLVLAGLGAVMVALLSQAKGSEVKGGGVLLLGPIPIVFGSDAKWATVAILLAMVLMVLAFLFFWA